MVENKLVIPDEMMQYLNQSILATESATPAKSDSSNAPESDINNDNDATTKDNATSQIKNTSNSSEKISDVATSDDSLLKNLGAIGSDLNISDIPVDLRSLDVSMSGNSGSLLATKSPDDKNPLQEQVIPEGNTEKCEQEFSKPQTVSNTNNNPLQSLQTMATNPTEQSNRMRVNSQKQNSISPKTMIMTQQTVLSPQHIAQSMLSPQSLPHSTMSPRSVMSPHNIPHSVMSPASAYNVMSPQSAMSVMSPQHNAMSPQSMQSLMSPQMSNQMIMSPRHNNIGSPLSQNMGNMVNMASPMTQNIASPLSHGMPSPMHPGLQSPMSQGVTSPMVQNMSAMSMNPPVQTQMNQKQNVMNLNINQQTQMQPTASNYMNARQNCNPKMPNRNTAPTQYPNANYQVPAYPIQNQQSINARNQNMQYPMMPQYNQQMPVMQVPQNQQTMVYNNQMINYQQPMNYPNQSNQMHPMQMSRSSMMSVDNSGNMSRGVLNVQYVNQNMQYPQPPPYNSVVNNANIMGPPPPKNNHQYNQAMMNNNQYYNHQRPYNQWDYPGNQFNKHNMQKSVQNSVNMSTGSQKPGGVRVMNCNLVKNGDQTDCSMNSLRDQNNQTSEVQVWDISQSQIEATNGRKKNQNGMRQETYQRTLEYVENCENWKSSEMVSSSTHPLQGGDNMVVNDLQTSLSSFYEENQYLQMIQ
jgi:transcriptional activator cubitus interruptus